MNGTRLEVALRGLVRRGETARSCWVTVQSRNPRATPRRWLKLRGRRRGREARNSSSDAAVNWLSSRMPFISANLTRSRSSRSSLRYLRPRALLCSTNRLAREATSSATECFLPVAKGNPAERLHGDLAVDLRGRRRPMADKVPDLLQAELGVDESLHERVAQG